MRYDKCWSERDVNLYFTTESREKNKEAFERTHLPIEKIYVEFSKDLPQDRDFIGEEELKTVVTSSSPEDYNRIFLIVGETGCGKSELCQWLEYSINDVIHVPIHISRSDTKMEEIAKILNSHLPQEMREPMASGELVDIAAGLIGGLLIAKLKIELAQNRTINQGDKRFLEKLFVQSTFKGKLDRDVANYQIAVRMRDKERPLLILSRKSFEFFPGVNDLSDVDGCYRFINRTITNTLKEYLKVSDVSKKLQQISQHYVKLGRRPVLLFEDLTSFSFLAEDLMDYLFDLAKGHFDVVIGWTTGFETGHRDYIFKAPDTLTYMKERLKARFVLTDEDQSTFFMEDTYEDLARKYLSAVKCGKCSICEIDRDGLYPFNSSCLDKIYENMQEEGISKKTPRIFLEFVLRRILQSPQSPWKTLSDIPYLRSVPSLIGQIYDEFPDFVELIRWYGRETNQHVEMESHVVELFGINTPDKPEKQNYVIPKSRLARLAKTLTSATEQKTGKVSEEDLVDFEQWVTTGGKFLDRDSLRNGVIKVLQMVMDPCELKNLSSTAPRTVGLFYQRGTDAIPVFIKDSGDDTFDIEYKVNVSRDSSAEVLEQLYLFSKGGDLPEEENVQVFEWARMHSLEYNRILKDNISNAMRIPIERFILFSKYLLANLSIGCTGLDAKTLKMNIEERLSIPPINDQFFKDAAEPLLSDNANIQGLFSSFFFLTSSFFDYISFRKVCSEIDLLRTLKEISMIDLRRLRESYKIGNKRENKPFRELVMKVRNYSFALNRLSYEESFSQMRSELGAVLESISDDSTLSEIRKRIDKIKEICGILEFPIEQSWIQMFERISNGKLNPEALRIKIKQILEDFPQCGNVFAFIAFSCELSAIQEREDYKVFSTLNGIVNILQLKVHNLIESLEREITPPSEIKRMRKAYDQLKKLTQEFT